MIIVKSIACALAQRGMRTEITSTLPVGNGFVGDCVDGWLVGDCVGSSVDGWLVGEKVGSNVGVDVVGVVVVVGLSVGATVCCSLRCKVNENAWIVFTSKSIMNATARMNNNMDCIIVSEAKRVLIY